MVHRYHRGYNYRMLGSVEFSLCVLHIPAQRPLPSDNRELSIMGIVSNISSQSVSAIARITAKSSFFPNIFCFYELPSLQFADLTNHWKALIFLMRNWIPKPLDKLRIANR